MKRPETRQKISMLRRGENCHFWRGGVSILNSLIRGNSKMKEWKRKIRERDGYICSMCRTESLPGKFSLMHVDHIIPLSHLISLHRLSSLQEALDCVQIWDINNGRVLCVACHKSTPTWGLGADKYIA